MIKEDFRTGAARSGIAHHPEIVLGANAYDSLGRHANFVYPDALGFIVFFKHSHPQLFRGQTQIAGQEGPGKANGIVFEVITETEVAQHFEKCMVPCGIAHVVQIIVLATGTHAALRGGSALVIPDFIASEQILELNHAGIGKQQGFVIARHQRTGCHDLMTLAGKVLEKFFTYIGRGNRHRSRHDGLGTHKRVE